MAVNSITNYVDFYPDSQLQSLGVDGFFHAGPANVAEDASVGRLTIWVLEAPNAELPMALRARAYLFTQVAFGYTIVPAAQTAQLSLMGKTRLAVSGSQLNWHGWDIVTTGDGGSCFFTLLNGDSTSRAVRDVGWMLPLHRDAATRPWIIEFEKANLNIGPVFTRVAGYYLDLTPGRHLPTLNELGLV